MPTTDELQIVYKAIDQMTSVQNKILATQKKMISQFNETGATASIAGSKMETGMKRGEKSLTSVEGQIAKVNKLLGFMGVQLETIDIYMLSALKVAAFAKLIQFAKDSVFAFENIRKAMLGVQVASDQLGLSFTDTMATYDTLMRMGKLSTLDLADAMRNLLKSGKDLKQVETIIRTLVMSGTVIGTQGNIPLGMAVKRSTEGLLLGISNLIDATKLTKNLDQMYLDLSKSIDKSVDSFTEYDKNLAQTNYFESEGIALKRKYTEVNVGLTKAISDLSLEYMELKKEVGEGLNVPITWSIQLTTAFISGLRKDIDLIAKAIKLQNLAITVPVTLSFQPIVAAKAFFKGLFTDPEFKVFSPKFNVKPVISGVNEAINEIKANYVELEDLIENTYADIFGRDSTIYKFLNLTAKVSQPIPEVVLPSAPRVPPVGAKKGDVDWPEEMAKRVDKAFKSFNDNMNANQAEAEQWSKTMRNIFEIEIRNNLNLLEHQRSTLEISKREYYEKKFELQESLLIKEQEYLKTLDKFKDTSAWRAQVKEVESLSNSLADTKLKLSEISGTFSEGMTFKFKKFIDETQTSFQAGTEMAEGILGSMSTSLNNLFTDFRNRDLKSWHSYLTNFANMVTQALQEIIVKMLVVKTLGAAFGMVSIQPTKVPLSGVAIHEGGLVERFHSGVGIGSTLKTDEILAVLQTKERVLSRKQNEFFESLGKQKNIFKETNSSSVINNFTSDNIYERFHSGTGMGSSIKTDEILAILQTKERVLSRKQNNIFESLGKQDSPRIETPPIINHFTFPSIDANSVASFIYQNKDVISNTVMQSMRNNHPLRRK